ncbi:MAG: sigma-E processing peptidase SpoIIGA, partial [Niameybacter sp.]
YLIPYESVGCKSDILLGFRMEEMILEKGMFHKTFNGCVVGIVTHELFKGETYKALLHPDYMMVS